MKIKNKVKMMLFLEKHGLGFKNLLYSTVEFKPLVYAAACSAFIIIYTLYLIAIVLCSPWLLCGLLYRALNKKWWLPLPLKYRRRVIKQVLSR